MSDTTATADPNLVPREPEFQASIERLFERIGEVSSLPSVATRIIEVVNDEDADADDLLKVVQLDVAFGVRVLRTVNSAYYSLRYKVRDLKSAINLLGFEEVRNLALTAHVSKLFAEEQDYGTYSREKLWDHLVGVASASRLVALVSGKGMPEEAYLCGLLHDMGYILLDQYIHVRFRQVIDRLNEETPTRAMERQILTFDHTELGEYVTRKWNFPKIVTDTIRYHHNPTEYTGEHRDTVAIVAVANALCSRKGLSAMGISNVPVPESAVFESLGIGHDELSSIWSQLEKTLELANIVATM